MKIYGALALAVMFAANGSAEPPPRVRLMCQGQASDDAAKTIFGTRTDGTYFEAQMEIDFVADQPRVKLPKRMIPGRSNGQDGWLELSDIIVANDKITARINVLTHPKISLDRRSGFVDLEENMGTFSGKCQPFDPASRAF